MVRIPKLVTVLVHASSTLLIWLCNGDQSSIGLLFQLAGLDQLGDHFSDIPGFQAAANMLLEGANSCRLAKQAPSADVIDQPFDPFSTLSDRSDALGAEAQLLPGSPGDACPPMHVLERDGCGAELASGCPDSGEADGCFGGASKEGVQWRILVNAIVDHTGEVEIFLFGCLVCPGELGDLLFDWAFDVDKLGGGTVPAVELATFHGEISGHLPGQQLRLGIPGARSRTQHQEAVKQAIIDRFAL